MRKFSMVSPRIWQSRKFQALPDNTARLAYFYLITSNHGNAAGCYHLPAGYAATDTGLSENDFIKARSALIASGLLIFDDETDEVFVPNWYEFNVPTTEKHITGIRYSLERIESETVFNAANEQLEAVEQALIDRKEKADAAKFAKEVAGKHGLAVIRANSKPNRLTSSDYLARERA
ncbi:hypothetical protein [Ahrensia sp. 13_GOM-1096m]|uniref:hypothetical protein n=1 Tax=Ahrensia sp. 13_GOM-1096m TaxID=1380380 RepID=UPI0004794481|nr:hypothetical protein [Ahrensia sp. 13_GOM-1096m]